MSGKKALSGLLCTVFAEAGRLQSATADRKSGRSGCAYNEPENF